MTAASDIFQAVLDGGTGTRSALSSVEQGHSVTCNPHKQVRKHSKEKRGCSPYLGGTAALAHPLAPIQLNPNWRVVDDPIQWVLQRRKGNRRAKNSGWRNVFFLRTRSGLLAYVNEYCGGVEPHALALLAALPEWHP